MLCNTCLSLDFRPLDECMDRVGDIKDEANIVFSYVDLDSFDEADILRWRRGEGTTHGYFFHHNSGDALMDSARKGCYLCAVMSFALFAESVMLPKPELSIQAVSSKDTARPVVLRTRLSPAYSTWRDDPDFEQMQLYCGQIKARLDALVVRHGDPLLPTYADICKELELAWQQDSWEPYLSNWSQHNLQLALSWRRNCLLTHDSCRIGTPLLPKRVIDVGIGDSAINFQPVLVEPTQPVYADYITLSHCWGDGHPVSSVDADEANRSWSLPPLSEWEQTFQDAVKVVRSLNVRYIWIDSPCILQGDRLDWQTESVKMAQYFQNATLCIHASRAKSGTDGLFGLRNPILTYPYHLVLPSDQNSPKFERFLCAGRAGLLYHDEVEPNSTDSPPSLRAWCLQEEILSPRMLCFGQKRIYWQCMSSFRSESFIDGPTRELDTENYSRDTRMHIDIPKYSLEWGGSRNPYHAAWYDFLKRFNMRNISYHNDVLPAIAGVAELFNSQLEDDNYLAGIWQRDMITGLLWSVILAVSTRTKRPTTSIQTNFDRKGLYAPSWSWISMAHQSLSFGKCVRLEGFARESPCAKLVSVDIKLREKSAPFGLIDLGILVFSAQCPRVTITPGIRRFKHGSFFDNFLSPSTFSARSVIHTIPSCRMELEPAEWQLQPGSPTSWPRVSDYQLTGQCDSDEYGEMSHKSRLKRQKRSYVMRFFDAIVSPHKTIDGHFLPLKTDQVEFGRIRTLGLVLVRTAAIQGCSRGEYYKRIGYGKFDLGPTAWKACNVPVNEIRLI